MELRRMRKEAGLTQKALAKKANVSLKTIRGYEQNDRDINKAQGIILYQLSKVLNCTMENLLELGGREEDETNNR